MRSPISCSGPAAALLLLLTICGSAHAQDAERPADAWAELNAQVQQAYRDERYDRGAEIGAKALDLAEKRFGSQDTRTIMSANNLALNYDALGKLDAAEPLFVRALQSHERVYGPDHALTLISLTNLAGLYQLRGRFDEAEAMLRRVVDARVRQFGEDSEDTVRARHNLQALEKARAEPPRPNPIAASGQVASPDRATVAMVGTIDFPVAAFAGTEFDRPAAERPWGLITFLPTGQTFDWFAGERDVRASFVIDRAGLKLARVAAPTAPSTISPEIDPVLIVDMAAMTFGETDEHDPP